MNNELKSASWEATISEIKSCHLSLLSLEKAKPAEWRKAFKSLIASIKDERKNDPAFCQELSELTAATAATYDFEDILEEYFDFLEDEEDYKDVITSCDELISLFKWENSLPSQYMFRKGNALEKSGKYQEAEAFGQEWLKKYPTDLYAAASNVFLLLELRRFEEAEELTEKYLRDDLVCDSSSDTFFMAAYRLYEMTSNIHAKQRVEKKMAEYQEMMN